MRGLSHSAAGRCAGSVWPCRLAMQQARKCPQRSRLLTSCQAERSNGSPDPEETQDEIVLSNWRLPEFWEGLTWDAAVPATCAVALSWVLTDQFIISKLPDATDAQCMLIWLIPTVLLDAVLWRSRLHQQQQGDVQTTGNTDSQRQGPALATPGAGLDLYRRRRSTACAARLETLPAVQKNVLLFLQTCAQQLAIQGVLSAAAVPLLQEVEREFPGVLPELPGLPGLAHVDPTLVAAAACTGSMVAMASYRIRCSAHAFHPDHLARSTLAFMASLGTQPDVDPAAARWRGLCERGPIRTDAESLSLDGQAQDRGPLRVQAALSAGREALLLTSCTVVYLQTDSILASVWVAYMAANLERRLASVAQGRL